MSLNVSLFNFPSSFYYLVRVSHSRFLSSLFSCRLVVTVDIDHDSFIICSMNANTSVNKLKDEQRRNVPDLVPGSYVYMMGICGTAMASLAGLLQAKGFKVGGSDQAAYPPMSNLLRSLEIPFKLGYSADNLNPAPDFVVVGNVISRNNPEVAEMLKRNIPYTSLPSALREWVIKDKNSFVVAGTHGKTTSTSLMAWCLEHIGQKPGFLIGGIPKNFGVSFRLSSSPHFVIEGDEYDTAFFDKVPKFIHYLPKFTLLTSVEFDHADIYKNIDEVKAAFTMLLREIQTGGKLVFYGQDQNIQALLHQIPPADYQVRSYGLRGGGEWDYSAELLGQSGALPEGRGQAFRFYKGEVVLGDVHLPLTGTHNLLNAVGVLALLIEAGFPFRLIVEAIPLFKGVKRRQEILGEVGGVLVMEDFAHHPTAVFETLKGLRAAYPKRRLVAVFEPRSNTSKRKVFQSQWAEAFSIAELVFLAKPFEIHKIPEGEALDVNLVVKDLSQKGVIGQALPGADEIVAALAENCRKDDLVVIMSNGGFDGIYKKLLETLAKQ
jgi:UDP-N-acetylmuramate: L-alanyl-gamma-D-glutamyl-meso-diaminopimelate ligase